MPRRSNNTSGEYRALLASFDDVFAASIAEKCVNLSDQEILAILSQSEYLKWRTRWYKGDYSQDFDETEIDTITALAASIQDKLVNGLDDCIECQEGDCIEYAPNASFIDWSPSTPGDVNDIPSGYRENPWYIIDQSIIGGYVPGDVLCDANSTMPQSVWDYLSIVFTSGAPRFRVHVDGPGQVELHLLRIAFGGIALVWQDDDYTTADVVDLQSYSLGDLAPGTVDLLTFIDNAIDQDFSDILIHERFFETDGPHHIDVSFLPILDANITQLGWGGGLRKVVLCGFDSMAIVPQFRQTENCVLEFSGDGGDTWLPIFDASCAKSVITYNEITNNFEVDGEPIVSGDTIINNTIIIDDTGGIQPDGLNKRCDVASYYSELMLPSLIAEIVTAKQQSATNIEALGAIIAFAVAVTGVIVTGGLGTPVFAGIAIAVTGSTLGSLIQNADPTAIDAETTPQFWQDVKCKIYCAMPNDGIIDEQSQQDIADAVATLTNYPATIPLLAQSIRDFSAEALGKFNIYGALYDGSNCDLCACASWSFSLHDKGYQSQYETLENNTVNVLTGGNVYRDSTEPLHDDNLYVELDLSKTPAILTKIRITGKAYKKSGDEGGRSASLELWDETTNDWYTQYSFSYTSGAGEDKWAFSKPFGADTVLDFPTTKVRIKQGGWGTGSSSWEYTKLQIAVIGEGINVLKMEFDEYNG